MKNISKSVTKLDPSGYPDEKTQVMGRHQRFRRDRQAMHIDTNRLVSFGYKEWLSADVGLQIAGNHGASNLKFQFMSPEDSSRHKQWCEVKMKGIQETRFFRLQEEVVMILKQKLLGSKFYSLNELCKESALSKTLKNSTSSSSPSASRSCTLSSLSVQTFIDMATKSKESSKIIQGLVKTAPPSEQGHLDDLIAKSLPQLLTHPFGNYVVQHAMVHNLKIKTLVCSVVIDRLSEMVLNEYSNRVVQALCRYDAAFLQAVVAWVRKYLPQLLNNISVIFLIESLFKYSNENAEVLALLQDLKLMLMRKLPDLACHKNFLRLLAAYSECCSDHDLQYLDDQFLLTDHMLEHLDNKQMSVLLLVLIQRKYLKAINQLLHHIQYNILDLFNTKFFKFVFFKLTRSESKVIDRELLMSLNNRLRKISAKRLSTMREDSNLFFCFLITSTLTSNQLDELQSIHLSLLR